MSRSKLLGSVLVTCALIAGCDDNKDVVNAAKKGAASDKVQNAVAEALDVLDISEREYGDVNALTLLFNSPLDPDQKFERHVVISPDLGTPVLSKDGRSLQFIGPEPLQKYDIQVKEGLKSATGAVLETGLSKSLKARDLPKLVAFETDGAVMIPGKVESLPLIAVNVPEAEINIYRVKPESSVQFFDEYQSLKSGDRWYFDEDALARSVDHVYTARIQVGEDRNKRNRAGFAVASVPNIDQGGVYLATVREPGGFSYQATWFSVSAIGLQSRDYGKRTTYIAQNAATGDLLEGVTLNILDRNSKVIATGETDEKGSWQVDNNWQRKSPRLILAQHNKQVSVLKYHAPSLDLSDYPVHGRPTKEVEIFTFAPRDIYRPGEELVFGSLMRDLDGNLLSGPLSVELIKPDADTAGTWRIEPSKPGYYEFRYDLPSNAILGGWQAKVFSPASKKNAAYFDFKVEAFLPERLRLVFDQAASPLSFELNDKIKIPVKGEYLYGAVAAGNRLDTQVTLNAWAEPFENLKGFKFGVPSTVDWQQFSLPSVNLNDAGETSTEFNLSQYNPKSFESPARINVRYSLFESGGRAINRSRSALFWPKGSFVGVKPTFENDQSGKDEKVTFELVRADKQGQLLSSGEIKATLYRLEEKYFWSHTPERGWHYQIEKNEYPVATEFIRLASDQPQQLSMPVEWGPYRLELDDIAGKSKTVYTFQAGEPWYYSWQTASDRIRPDLVTLALDKESYQAGDRVKVKLASPTEGKAVVLLETDQVLHSQEVLLNNREAEVEIPLPKDLNRHDVYISTFVVAPTEHKDKVSKRSIGIVHLPLDRADRELDVTIEVAESLLPETKANLTIKVTDKAGKPVEGDYYISLTAVDSGVLSVTGYKQTDPFNFFYGRRAYTPKISDMYNDLVEPHMYKDAQIRWGGDGELERGGEVPPTEVEILSLYHSPISLENGEATVELDLPAFDGELTLTALAMSDNNFGLESETTKVASPIVAQLSMPRFLAIGDQTTLALDLANVSDDAQNVSVKLTHQGAVSLRQDSFELSLDKGEKQVLPLVADAVELGEGLISAEITFGDVQLNREWVLGVRSAYPAVYGSMMRVLAEGESIQFPAGAIQDLTKLQSQLRVANTPDLNAQQHFKTLMSYPYGCLEQTTSKSQPLALLLAGDKAPAYARSVTNSQFENGINAAISRYSELQLANGGFGLWDKFSPEEHWLTAYATDFLLHLDRSGFAVPNAMLSNAVGRLRSYVHNRKAIPVRTWSDIPSHYEISYKAYAAYVLAKQGEVTLGPLRDLAEQQLNDSRGVLPGVHLGLAIIETGSLQEGEALVKQALSKERAEGYLGDYGSVIRDKAMAIHTILELPNAHSLHNVALQQIPDLLSLLKQQRWLSTQEKAALLHLSNALNQMDKEGEWQGKLLQGEIETLLEATTELGRNLDSSELASTVFTNAKDKPTYASFHWTGIPKQMPKHVNEGINLDIDQFRVLDGNAQLLKKNQVLKTGDLLLTRVSLYSEKRVPDGLLVSLLPAGVELENQNLQHALKLKDIRIDGESVSQRASISYQAFKDDRYVAAVDIPEKREQVVYFLSRAVTPGHYLVPPVQAESMYKPAHRGVANSIEYLTVVP